MSRNIQVKNADGSIVTYANPACPPPTREGYTNYLGVPDSVPPPVGDTTSVERWRDGAAVWIAPIPTLATLSVALNQSLAALFKTAPAQAQITYSNITKPIASLITAGQLTAAIAAFEGMIDDDLVPPKYAPLITSAIALITGQESAFAAVIPPARP